MLNCLCVYDMQDWKWEQELVWRDYYDHERRIFHNWTDYEKWNKPPSWPESYIQWKPHAHKNYK